MANKKISQLTGATTPLIGTEELAIVQGGQTLKTTTQDIADLAGGSGYLIYSATLIQNGIDAPVATVLENTIGNIVWTKLGTGRFDGTLSGVFTADKVLFLTSIGAANIGGIQTTIDRIDDNIIRLTNLASNGDYIDYFNICLEVRIYP